MIRELGDEDAPAAVALLRRLEPFWPVSEESLLHDAERQPPRAERRVWVADGGYAFARRLLGVEPERRRQGFGAELLDAALGHIRGLGVHKVQTWCQPGGAKFLEHRGWERERERVLSAVELTAPPPVEPPDGIELVPLSALDPLALYELDRACAGDEPGDEIDFGSLDEYRRTELGRPLLDLDGSFAAVADGEPVAMAMVLRHGPIGHNGFTCTHPAWRGRGLATLVKSASLRWAYEHGVERVATMNDAENPAMLRVNEKLGYRPVRRETRLVLSLAR